MSSSATRSKKGFMSKVVAAVGSKTRSKRGALQNLRVALHEREMERQFEAGETRRLAAQAAANAKAAANANAKAAAKAKAASNERARMLAATLLNRSEREGTRSRRGSALREPTKHKNTSKQTQEQNPGGIAPMWGKSREEFNSMSLGQQKQYLQVLKKLGYSSDDIREIYLD